MNKTISITLGGHLFVVEEDAYQLLQAYLQSIATKFSAYEDADEIIQDIETRIAELLLEQQSPATPAITKQQVDTMMQVMGPATAFEEDAEEPVADSSDTYQLPRRFYRDPENAVLGGVVSGIAHYFGWDPTLLRVLVAICAITGILTGFIFIAYLVLWIVTPKAITVTERMQMHGRPVNLSSVEQQVKSAVQKGKDAIKKKSPEVKEAMQGVASSFKSSEATSRRQFNSFIQRLGGILKQLGSYLWAFLVGAIMVGAILGVVAITVGFSTALFLPQTSVSAPFDLLIASTQYYVFIVSLCLVLLLPVISIGVLSAGYFWKTIAPRVSFWVTSLVVWVIALAGMIGAGMTSQPLIAHIQDTIDRQSLAVTQPAIEIASFSELRVSGDYDVEVVEGEQDQLIFTGSEQAYKRFALDQNNASLHIKQNRPKELCFLCWDATPQLVITTTQPLTQIELTQSTDLMYAPKQELNELIVRTSGASDMRLSGVINELSVWTQGSSDIHLQGEANRLTLITSGSTDVYAQLMQADRIAIEASGASDFELSIVSSLTLFNEGSTDLYYYGNPEVIIEDKGSLDIIPLDQVESDSEVDEA